MAMYEVFKGVVTEEELLSIAKLTFCPADVKVLETRLEAPPYGRDAVNYMLRATSSGKHSDRSLRILYEDEANLLLYFHKYFSGSTEYAEAYNKSVLAQLSRSILAFRYVTPLIRSDCVNLNHYSTVKDILLQESKASLLECKNFGNIKMLSLLNDMHSLGFPMAFEVAGTYLYSWYKKYLTDMVKPIYTREIAAGIIERFEEILESHGIVIPCATGEERDDDNAAALFGSVYYDLLDKTEQDILSTIREALGGANVIRDRFA